jgi:ribonuclease R
LILKFYELKKNKKKRKELVKLTGIVDHVKQRFCFISVEGMTEDIKVKSQNMNGAIHEDLVELHILNNYSSKIEGKITKVVKRKLSEFSGIIEDNKDFAFFIPNHRKIYSDFFIKKRNSEKYSSKKKYLAKITSWTGGKKPFAKVIRCIGDIGSNEAEIHTIMHDFNLPIKFPIEVNKEAEKLNSKISEKEFERRLDLRKDITFTIDPEDAKDFDDALSVKINKEIYEVGIHIADVSHFFNNKSLLNKEAEKRATSVYLVDRTIPMLPEKLSNDLCSLKPDIDRLTFSVIIKINKDFKIIDKWVGKTVIHSKKRFTYENAQNVIDKGEGLFSKELISLNKIAKHLRQERFENGSFNFKSNEVKFQLDEQKKPIEIVKKERKDTHKLVEEFMLLANKIVAEQINEYEKKYNKKFTFVYRIHEDPDKVKLIELQKYIKQFGYTINVNEQNLSSSINNLMKEIKGKPEENSIEKFAIRSMSKARYSTEKEKHFGLAFKNYSHFTSPIRRFPDVMVHRLLQYYINGSKPKDKLYYDILCKHCSKMEINATKAERESIKYKQAEYMANFIGQEFEGVISGITEWGIYVEIVKTKCEGLVKISSLTDDKYDFNNEKVIIVGRKFKKSFGLGQPIKVAVAGTNIEKRTIDLDLI